MIPLSYTLASVPHHVMAIDPGTLSRRCLRPRCDLKSTPRQKPDSV